MSFVSQIVPHISLSNAREDQNNVKVLFRAINGALLVF
jgi:hypothetical protein